jgi:hypothetical protein
MKTTLIALAAAAAGFAVAAPSFAAGGPNSGRIVNCRIEGPKGKVEYAGKCLFRPGKNGSFSLEHPKRKFLVTGTMMISVYVVRPGVAEVRGLTKHGINSRWGEARRSKTNPGCWVDGGEYKICAG